ncbi:hypothetical protein A8990_106145 [Paenibacillus taihuensis]|uniref:Uncharacterized protein n=1 Tax=Paenibacillus taihuensis TaxID=1156355 RepID=A0A3D9SBI7_9BACL|nr:hypothetical protein A8990_106145 [Paenibacillus taihuensis]
MLCELPQSSFPQLPKHKKDRFRLPEWVSESDLSSLVLMK